MFKLCALENLTFVFLTISYDNIIVLQSVIAGGITSSLFMLIILLGNKSSLSSKDLVYPKMPISVEGCDPSLTATLNVSYIYEPEFTQVREQRRLLAFPHFPPQQRVHRLLRDAGGRTCIASLVFGVNDPRDMDHDLFSPCVRKFLPASSVVKSKWQEEENEAENVEAKKLAHFSEF
jgi:hypothetical protein